jgi:hypothetical protein
MLFVCSFLENIQPRVTLCLVLDKLLKNNEEQHLLQKGL